MKKLIPTLLIGLSVLGLAVLTAPRAVADDETEQTAVRIKAPLDAVDCTAGTVSTLGLTIDIRTAAIAGPGCNEDDDQGEDNDEQGDDDGSEQTAVCPSVCTDLVPGAFAQVTLTNDTDFVATEVRQRGHDTGDHQGDGEDFGSPDCSSQAVEVQAPIQAVDTTNQTVQVLGLVVDVSAAHIEGDDDESDDASVADWGDHSGDSTGETGDDDDQPPPTLADLMIGQFVRIRLTSSQPPFQATDLRIENFDNEVEVEVEDSNGQPVDDVDALGNPAQNLRVDISEKVSVRKTSASRSSGASRLVHRTLRFHRTASGSFVVSGLPTGRAKITVTRSSGASVSSGRLVVDVVSKTKLSTQVRLSKRHGS